MNILFTVPEGDIREHYFPDEAIAALKKLGNVIFNDKEAQFTPAELKEHISDIDVCLTHWGCPQFTAEVLQNANRLGLIAHAAGSVGDLVSDHVYAAEIKVCSANKIMAKSTAEGVLAYILAGLRQIPRIDRGMRKRLPWKDLRINRGGELFGAKIGLVGLGTIGRCLLDLLKPFDVRVKVYDPYIAQTSVGRYSNVELCASLDEVLQWGDIISLHASLTKETRHMINDEKLRTIRDHALFVNTARGAIVDEGALIRELQSGRLEAILDVYATEPLPLDSPLRNLDNVILMPHVATVVRERMTYAMLAEIERYSKGEPLQHEISYEQFKLMTKEHNN